MVIVYACRRCHWIGTNPSIHNGDTEYCPRCGSSNDLYIVHQNDTFTSDDLEKLWEIFGEVSINDNDKIEDYFLDFPVGTNRFEIWHWFDEKYPEGVAKLSGCA